ncbi:MAG TPA: hypothetical protein PK765_00920 [bacterium]|nr:hypothetical protein [bacterium]
MAKLPFLRLTIFALPVLVLSGCFWSTSAPSDSSELLPSSPDESTNTLSGGVESGSTAKPIGAVRAASGTIVTFADDKTITLTRTGVISLDSGYKIVGNGEVV